MPAKVSLSDTGLARTSWTRAHVLQVNGRIEWSSSYFWKQKYCRSHSSDGTPHCCSCNKLKAVGTKWLTLSDKRMVCHDCSTTVVHDSAQAQPLLDEVILFCTTLCVLYHVSTVQWLMLCFPWEVIECSECCGPLECLLKTLKLPCLCYCT